MSHPLQKDALFLIDVFPTGPAGRRYYPMMNTKKMKDKEDDEKRKTIKKNDQETTIKR